MKRDATSMRSMYVEEENGMLSLRVLVDRYSVEIFVNNGEQVMTSLIYTPLSENSISFSCDGEACMNITCDRCLKPVLTSVGFDIDDTVEMEVAAIDDSMRGISAGKDISVNTHRTVRFSSTIPTVTTYRQT